MRRIQLFALAIASVAVGLLVSDVRGQVQNAPAVFSPTSGDYATADVRVITPGVVFASGLPDIAADFTKETGKKVGVVGVAPGTFTPLGRTRMGLAVRAGAPKPDISTVEKLAVALKSAKAVMRSN